MLSPSCTTATGSSLSLSSTQTHLTKLDPDLFEPLHYLQSIGEGIVDGTHTLQFKPLYKNFKELGDKGPVESILLKVMSSDKGIIQNVSDFKKYFLARLEEKLGKKVFNELIKEGSIDNIGSYNIGNDGSFFVTLKLDQLRLILTPQKFDQWKKDYLDIAQEASIIEAGKLSSTLVENLTLEECNALRDSFQGFSSLSKEDQEKVMCERDLWSVYPNHSSEETNQYLLGCEGSIFRRAGSMSEYVKPGNQVSILTKTIFADGPQGEFIFYPYILSVAPPGLDAFDLIPQSDDKRQLNKSCERRPELPYYIDTSTFPPKVNMGNYATSFDALVGHVLLAVDRIYIIEGEYPPCAVLCAAGCGVFMQCFRQIDMIGQVTESYATNYTAQAEDVAAIAFVKMIEGLRARGIDDKFTDFNRKSQAIWDKVNERLGSADMELISPIIEVVEGDEASIGKGWVKDKFLLLNAGDPDALKGNKGVKDPTTDGQYARRSVMQFLHFLVCRMYHSKMIQLSNQNVNQVGKKENCSIQ